MRTSPPAKKPWRIAVVWTPDWMQAQETFNAFCRRADQESGITVRRFDAAVPDFSQGVLQPLQQWEPDGIVIRVKVSDHLKELRQLFPSIPIISTVWAPLDLVNSCVVADVGEIFTMEQDHYSSRGLKHLALYCATAPHATPSRLAAFHAIAPGGFEIVYDGGDPMTWFEKARQWLKNLPKPVGILTAEVGAGCSILHLCKELELRVPNDVQIIGVDDADVCLECEPHLTSIALPSSRIGEIALETIIHYLRHTNPLPSPVVTVKGCALIQRGTTKLASAGKLASSSTVKIMNAHARKGVSVAGIAKLSGVGIATLYRQFSQTVGGTPGRHLRQLRIQEACRLLRESSMTITDVTEACGFQSIFSFSRSFRRETGQTPTAYRRRANSGK